MSQDFTNLSYHQTRINGNHNILGDGANDDETIPSFPYNFSSQNMPILDSSYLSFLECLQGSTPTFIEEEKRPLLEVEESKETIVVESEIITSTMSAPPISSISSLSCEVNVGQDGDSSKTMKQENQVEEFAYDGGENPTKENKQMKKVEKKQRGERYAFMTKSEVDHLDDGYKWRKYGQKPVKNSSYPRSYYRCTTQKCPVKKRVERSLQDPAIVMTTYEGKHNHHLPAYRIGNVAAMLPHNMLTPPPPQSMMTTGGVSQDSILHQILMPHSYNNFSGYYSTRNNDSTGYAYDQQY